jgi:PAS domain S-box-containing protein
MRLADFIVQDMDRILSAWEAFAATRLPAAATMDSLELRDHARQMLEAIVHDLGSPQTTEQQVAKSVGLAPVDVDAPESAAQTHAVLRAESGFNIEQLASEYRALRASVLALWFQGCAPAAPYLDDVIRFNEAIDQALAESITCFSAYALRVAAEERALAEASQSTLNALMEHIPEGITIADAPDVVITRVSRYGQELTGRPNAEIAGIPAQLHTEHWGLCDLEGKALAPERLPLTRATVCGEVVRNEEVLMQRPDGTTVTLLCNAGPIRDAKGTITGGLCAWREIDDVKQARRALQAVDRRKDEFIAILAHELRNPLAPIRTSVRVLGAVDASAANLQRSREIIERQVKTMARLLDDLLDVSRIKQRKLELRKETVLLWTVLGNAIETSRPLIDARQHKLNVALPDEPVPMNVDPVRLCQVVANLLNNSAKYSPPGGQIELVVTVDADTVRIVVKDSGLGMTRDSLERVFELFSQAETSLCDAEGGLGIGLSLAKGLIALHGGELAATSDGLGTGCTFTITLPRDPTATMRPANDTTGAVAVRRRRVLVADDNRDSADSLGLLLSLDGHEVHIAYTAEEALALALATQVEIAFLDVGMPDMDGYELARRLRAVPFDHRPTLVAVTGWGRAEDKRRAIDAGFDHHVTKPLDPDALPALFGEAT